MFPMFIMLLLVVTAFYILFISLRQSTKPVERVVQVLKEDVKKAVVKAKKEPDITTLNSFGNKAMFGMLIKHCIKKEVKNHEFIFKTSRGHRLFENLEKIYTILNGRTISFKTLPNADTCYTFDKPLVIQLLKRAGEGRKNYRYYLTKELHCCFDKEKAWLLDSSIKGIHLDPRSSIQKLVEAIEIRTGSSNGFDEDFSNATTLFYYALIEAILIVLTNIKEGVQFDAEPEDEPVPDYLEDLEVSLNMKGLNQKQAKRLPTFPEEGVDISCTQITSILELLFKQGK